MATSCGLRVLAPCGLGVRRHPSCEGAALRRGELAAHPRLRLGINWNRLPLLLLPRLPLLLLLCPGTGGHRCPVPCTNPPLLFSRQRRSALQIHGRLAIREMPLASSLLLLLLLGQRLGDAM
mmetsp:Transcript_23605/g.59331  ORF Transcript_23605/g.59331 Transcript_23605/m.59331 type:complete len:122 (-) Transcript_23605:40-405(-)